MQVSRAEHLAGCKRRALEHVDKGDLYRALASMERDLMMHPETAPALARIDSGWKYVARGDQSGLRRFINGFN